MLADNVRSEKVVYIGELPATAKGKAAVTVKLKCASTTAQLVMFSGNLNFSGKIVPVASGDSIPGTLRFQLKHRSASNAVVSTTNFDVNVQPDGVIRVQKLPFNATTLVTPKQSVELSLIPLDKPLSKSNANLKIAYAAPASGSTETSRLSDDPDISSVPAGEAKKIQLVYVGLLPPTSRGVEPGDFRFGTVRGPDDPWNGNLSIKGRLTSSGGPLPQQLQLVVRHTKSAGAVLRTEKFDINVAADGAIALQKFPITTENAAGIKESLQFSVISVDRDFPLSSVKLTLTYAQT